MSQRVSVLCLGAAPTVVTALESAADISVTTAEAVDAAATVDCIVAPFDRIRDNEGALEAVRTAEEVPLICCVETPADHADALAAGATDTVARETLAEDETVLVGRVRAYGRRQADMRDARRALTQYERIVDTVPIGLLVLDAEGTIVTINDQLTRLFDAVTADWVGESLPHLAETDAAPAPVSPEYIAEITDAVTTGSDHPDVRTTASDVAVYEEERWIDSGEDARCYDLRLSQVAFGPQTDGHEGFVALLQDITDAKRREETLQEREAELERQKSDLELQTAQLEYQNERLDKFAGIVSHDLRNPLSVAEGRIELLLQDLDSDEGAVDRENVEKVQTALHRMGDIIDNALSLAREGKAITETQRVALARTAERAWANVDTGAATLALPHPVDIRSDPDRLLTVFENLFRNAVEHSSADPQSHPPADGADVTVRIGLLPDGFYVEDDGPGIPDDEKERVLDEGYTTAEDGTGFGLAIVRDIVRAHGWNLAITDGRDGGARIEITGVPFQWTRERLVETLGESLGHKKAEELVTAAMADCGVDRTRFDRETTHDILDAIVDHQERGSLAAVAARTVRKQLDSD